MTVYVSRAGWGARAPSGGRNEIGAHPKGSAIHWNGPGMGLGSHSECTPAVQGIQRFHMDSNGWSDIAYNLLVCPHDYVYEGRGQGVGSAANGSTQANADWYAVMALVGEGDSQPAGLYDGVAYAANMVRGWGAGSSVCGHRDLYGTECPGDALYSKVKAGAFSGGSAPTPDPTPPPAGKAPPFPYPADHYLGQASPPPECHSGYYASDQPNVRTWQQQMADRGWTIDVDGIYGPQSEDVARAFQSEKGLDDDGLVGPHTWAAAWTEPVT